MSRWLRCAALHDEIPTRDGSLAARHRGFVRPVRRSWRRVEHLGRRWLFNDHGHRTLEWSDHCNRGYTRWILREHGITLTGPEPRIVHAACATGAAARRGGDRDAAR